MERFRIICTVIWCLFQYLWLRQDALLRDGDEEGHVGAAEIVRQQLSEEGWISFLLSTWWQDLGEYPPLYASYLGAWWHVSGGYPEDLLLRCSGLPLLLISAWLISEVTRKREGSYNLCFVLMLFLPLPVALSRHYMIETMLLPLTAACVWVIYCIEEKSVAIKGFLLGILFAMGLLTKQTFILGGVGVFVLLGSIQQWKRMFPTTTIIAGGWYFSHIHNQQDYLTTSIASNTPMSITTHILAPLGFLGLDVLGPILSCALLLTIAVGWKRPQTRPFLFWLLLSLLLCMLIPKKYPRLMLTLSIPCVMWISEYLSQRQAYIVGLGTILWTGLYSFLDIPYPTIYGQIDTERCPQQWMRPPYPYDFGRERILKEIQLRPKNTPIVMSEIPDIPCSVQTTHAFPYHLEIYLRRHGFDNPIILPKELPEEHILLSWEGDIQNPNSLTIQ